LKKCSKIVAYTDDVGIIGRRLQDVEEVFTSLVEETNQMGLEMKGNKTKFMIASRKTYNENKYVKLGTYNFVIIKDYMYLGTNLTNENELRPEIEKKFTSENRIYYALLKAIPFQAWTGPEDSRRMRFPDFKTIGT
jgi:hypothetical protein